MFENLFDYFRVLYERDNTHPAQTFCTGKGIYLVDLLDKTRPISFVLIGGFIRLKYGGYKFMAVPFFSLAPRHVTNFIDIQQKQNYY